MFKNSLLKLMPYKEQGMVETNLVNVMKRLKIEDFTFNWDRSSCYVEFSYKEEPYKLEHSMEKARKQGIILKNGMDCLIELTQSLEDLCVIIDRGTYNFETWISGMKQQEAMNETPIYQEEFHISYKSTGEQARKEASKQESPDLEQPSSDRNEQLFPFGPDLSLKDFYLNQLTQSAERKIQ
ncbi:hypothetical protein CEH05_07850 [Halobacillus halophilus]|uniref:Uncharacterized protein n=1 Tax=Halobacillus halophilus (strain ATCC 35676 / DSM 2266 / JCM 20832 / KCTC 3685 / LMG 17431 / NBRC 102448 / NCIMB 2269) TaxID=866895 RepID=I0JL89_HALH3|nr:hypothetical protein [Halobacillus halophilus]ASF39031.1 hypothetical protein CEH05_07850 [Halobacillus halophilus]CCG44909.1 hypothetical protein HBHAL_2563 [Halobacillus halophilus DSM 2266]